jgi:hypothetical protein
MITAGKNRIMIYGPKDDGTYVVEFRTAAGETPVVESTPGGRPKKISPVVAQRGEFSAN